MNLRETINHLIQLDENTIKDFVTDKQLIVKGGKIKGFLFHGTAIHPKDFELSEDYEDDGSGNTYVADLPEGVVFLTNDFREAQAYGQYVIPCELKAKRVKTFKVNTTNPSEAFDDDFSGFGNLAMYSTFVNGGYDALEVQGATKSTFITYPEMVVPRTDLAITFYSNK